MAEDCVAALPGPDLSVVESGTSFVGDSLSVVLVVLPLAPFWLKTSLHRRRVSNQRRGDATRRFCRDAVPRIRSMRGGTASGVEVPVRRRSWRRGRWRSCGESSGDNAEVVARLCS
ncbi:hypothetical protein MTO96_015069 [Rhipicephalus appendiculatus]